MKPTSLLLALMLLSLDACGTSGPADSYCAVARPIYLTKDDRLSEPTLRAIVSHDQTWERVCR